MILIKIGGGNKINIPGIVEGISNLSEQCIIVHGANKLRDELAEKLKIEKKIITSVSGFSSVLSSENLMDVQLMAYAGLKNKRLVELCQKKGINAIGLTGIDGGLIKGKKNKGIRVRENGKLKIVRDNSGKAFEINTDLLQYLLSSNYLPVITIPILAEDGTALNTENDDVVALLGNELKADTIVQFIEAPGLLRNIKDENSIIQKLSKSELEQMKDSSEGRIKRKLYALLKLFSENNPRIIIADGRADHPLKNALMNLGTLIS